MSDPMSPVPVNPASKGLIARIQAILMKPAETWDTIAAEPSTIQSIYMGYVIPLAAIGPIAAAIGSLLIGMSVALIGGNFLMFMVSIILTLAVSYVVSLAMIYVTALVIDGLAPNFNGEKNLVQAFKVAAYSMTAGWVAGILGIIPFLGLLILLGVVYNIYLLYVGLPKLMKVSADKAVPYTAVVIVVCIVLYLVAGAVTLPLRAIGGLGMAGSMFGHKSSIFGGNDGALNGNFTVNGPNGKASVNLGQMEAAASQMAAQASAAQNGATVKVADPQALLDLMPANFQGAARSDTSTSSGGAAGISASTAEATYTLGTGTIHLKVADLGTMSGLGAMATAVNMNTSSSSATGYEKITTQNGQLVTEKYDTAEKSGEYSVVLNGRVSVDADGNGVDMATMKNLVASVDLNKAQSLTK